MVRYNSCFIIASSPNLAKVVVVLNFCDLRHMATAVVALEMPLSVAAKTPMAVNWVQSKRPDPDLSNSSVAMS